MNNLKRYAQNRKQGSRGLFCGALVLLLVAATLVPTGDARQKATVEPYTGLPRQLGKVARELPNSSNRTHRVGNLWLTITNWGTFGSSAGALVEVEGEFIGKKAPSLEYPAGSDIDYLYQGAIWFGAIVDGDTLVSLGADGWEAVNELYPDAGGAGEIIQRSNRRSSPYYHPDAISEQEFVAVYYDTLTDPTLVNYDSHSGRAHKPLGLKITQTSYSWSYDYAQNFILMDFVFKNIGQDTIKQPYMGLFLDADVYHWLARSYGYSDDYSGYLLSVPSAYPGLEDTINCAWTADNDGDPLSSGSFDYRSPTGIAGTRVVRGPSEPDACGPAPLNFAFNWWSSNADTRFDWGPQMSPGMRNQAGGFGTPSGDSHKYRLMANREFDYGQLFSAVDYSEQGWLEPTLLGNDIANGYDTRYLFSFGPLEDMGPDDTTYVTVGFITGKDFHVAGDDFRRFFNPNQPQTFYDKLDFTNFAQNARWAAWVFDNPGIDTDSNGCRGVYSLAGCLDTIITDREPTIGDPYNVRDTIYENCDTIWTTGDGVPDFKGPPPPSSPDLEVSARPGEITVRWTGERSETEVDGFTLRKDFEGYRVYIAEFNTISGYQMVASWDIVDYQRYFWKQSAFRWVQTVNPLSLDTLLAMYGQTFDPRDHPAPRSAFVDEHDSAFYFMAQDWNMGNEYLDGGIVVDNIIQQTRIDSLQDSEGVYRIFGHYECTITGLLPSQPYWVAVTAFDFGNRDELAPLESSVLINSTPAYATQSYDPNAEGRSGVIVYPNPYIISEDYRGRGYEDRDQSGWSERERRIHFTNLPPKATIKIYSIDGDLIYEINHPEYKFSDTEWHTSWDMITRNTQGVVSGIYLYTVESDFGTQIGKLVIIK